MAKKLGSIDDLFNSAYPDRQLALFVTDEVWQAEAKLSNEATGVGKNLGAIPMIALTVAFPFVGIALDLVSEARKNGLEAVLIPRSWLGNLSLPPGHPRDAVLYAAHPTDPRIYLPVADFHRFAFEHKFSELLLILMHLGAVTIAVEHVSGWGRDLATRLAVMLPLTEDGVEAAVSRSSNQNRSLLFSAELAGGGSPSLPDKLVWLGFEPTWNAVAEARLRFGLKEFAVNFQYRDDYGINGGLRLRAQRAGFDLGGSFEEHKETVWRVSGRFA
jgi:hypothetical protein